MRIKRSETEDLGRYINSKHGKLSPTPTAASPPPPVYDSRASRDLEMYSELANTFLNLILLVLNLYAILNGKKHVRNINQNLERINDCDCINRNQNHEIIMEAVNYVNEIRTQRNPMQYENDENNDDDYFEENQNSSQTKPSSTSSRNEKQGQISSASTSSTNSSDQSNGAEQTEDTTIDQTTVERVTCDKCHESFIDIANHRKSKCEAKIGIHSLHSKRYR